VREFGSDTIRGPQPRHLAVELPSGAALRWIGALLRLTWLPFTIAIVGRWLATSLEVLGLSLLAFAVIELGGDRKTDLPIPQVVLNWLTQSSSRLVAALLLALATVVIGRAIETLVDWSLPWIHLKVNRKLTPEVMEAAVEPTTRRLLDPPTAVQRWLLKIDISFFIFESLAETIGDLGTIVIILAVTFTANGTAGQVALGFLVLWLALAAPLMFKALRASQRMAYSHEIVGRIIRDSAALRAELNRPSLRTFWRLRNAPPLAELQDAIKWQGLWNVGLLGTLGIIARTMPIAAVLAASASGSLGSALAVFLYLTRMATPLASLASTLPWVQQNLISVQRLFRVVETDRDRIAAVPEPFIPHIVRVRDWIVSFADGSKLKYPDLELSRKYIVCVVGPSGSGKSSLLDSLAGQLSAAGTIFVDDVAVVPSDPKWRETCALVRQEPELVPGTLFDNLRDFPLWRETPVRKFAVDRIFATRALRGGGVVAIDEKGVSVGQRRAIAVLRALGSDAPVLLLDEPVAGLDDALVGPIAQAIVEAHGEGRIILLSAHEHDLKRLDFSAEHIVVVRLRELGELEKVACAE
jgi:ABC-type multidrug transport system fused ATPase/permease subunit